MSEITVPAETDNPHLAQNIDKPYVGARHDKKIGEQHVGAVHWPAPRKHRNSQKSEYPDCNHTQKTLDGQSNALPLH
jgi:hypothetical protein